ncbi:hypothetical protein [Pseudomonas fluorescens]|uniref:hypothetical protein n=1 Tax=Pseudomonas fluorescens TaxID=294 RepID=UPI0016205D76|nr:hypothetical protein [Pseudomonas fluorescens]
MSKQYSLACVNVSDASPSLLHGGIQVQPKTVTADAQHDKVIMKASGYTYPVESSVRRAAAPDRRMEVLGTVVDSGRGKLLEFQFVGLGQRSRNGA